MPNDELLTDDHVAELLAKEASECSIKYSAIGLEAFNTKSKPANVHKPNTRFLRHIIQDTDAHNKALLAKEAAESKARLQDLEHAEEAKRQRTNPNAKDIRMRQLGDIQSILGSRKRGSAAASKSVDEARDSRRRSSRDRESRRSSRRDADSARDRRDKASYGRLSRSPHGDRKGSRHTHGESSRSSRRRHNQDSSEDDRRQRRHRPKDRSRSPRRRRSSRSPREHKSKHRHRSPLKVEGKPGRDDDTKDADSDPLEDIIGPAPPPKYRGRGAIGGASGLDRRFSDSYNPKDDVMPDEDQGDTWDDAVEAYRDRQKLRQKQEERMREAGFSDQQIQKLGTHASTEKTGDDVVWSKAGQKREWDRGKGDDDENMLVGILSEDN